MSKFIDERLKSYTPYVPGEQPKERKYIKLNTNESPFPPSALALKLAREAAGDCELYPDPEYAALVDAAAEKFGLQKENLLFTNGSDEALQYAFAAYCQNGKRAVFADITYGFYDVFADLYGANKKIVPLKEDFSICPAEYSRAGGTVFLANPNAPTGKALTKKEVLSIVTENLDNVVVVDEAYIDFGGESVLPFVNDFDNLIVVRTFSKSRSLAGARVGFAAANKALIDDLKLIKYSSNPYNLSRMDAAAALGALLDEAYFEKNRSTIIENRETMTRRLEKIGFTVLPSRANFIFARREGIPGKTLYSALRERGILVRHFEKPRIADFLRITVGNADECNALVEALEAIVKETL